MMMMTMTMMMLMMMMTMMMAMRTLREMGRRKSKTEVITWVRELTSWKGKVFGDLGI